MKNVFKTMALIAGIAVIAVACDPPQTSSSKSEVIDTPLTKIDTASKTAVDTIKRIR